MMYTDRMVARGIGGGVGRFILVLNHMSIKDFFLKKKRKKKKHAKFGIERQKRRFLNLKPGLCT